MSGLYSKVEPSHSNMASTPTNSSASTYATQADFLAAIKQIGNKLKSLRAEVRQLGQRTPDQTLHICPANPGASRADLASAMNSVKTAEDYLRNQCTELQKNLNASEKHFRELLDIHQKSCSDFFKQNAKSIREVSEEVYDLKYKY